jgi:hypothetical protein
MMLMMLLAVDSMFYTGVLYLNRSVLRVYLIIMSSSSSRKKRKHSAHCMLHGQLVLCTWWTTDASTVVDDDGDDGDQQQQEEEKECDVGVASDPPDVLRVRLMQPKRPAILWIETGDLLHLDNGLMLRVEMFVPTKGKLVRGGVVRTI